MSLPLKAALALHILDRTKQQQIIRHKTTYIYIIGWWSTANNFYNIPYRGPRKYESYIFTPKTLLYTYRNK